MSRANAIALIAHGAQSRDIIGGNIHGGIIAGEDIAPKKSSMWTTVIVLGLITGVVYGAIPAMHGTSVIKAWKESK